MEFVDLSRFFLAFAFVLGLIGIAALLLKRYGIGTRYLGKNREARLEILETLPLDARHRLMIIRRDSAEFLVVLGPQGVNLVEQRAQGEPDIIGMETKRHAA